MASVETGKNTGKTAISTETALRVVAEENLAVHAAVRAFLFLDGPRADEAERPPLELILVLRSEFVCAGEVGRFAHHLHLQVRSVGVVQPIFDQGDGEAGEVDANALPAMLIDAISKRVLTS